MVNNKIRKLLGLFIFCLFCAVAIGTVSAVNLNESTDCSVSNFDSVSSISNEVISEDISNKNSGFVSDDVNFVKSDSISKGSEFVEEKLSLNDTEDIVDKSLYDNSYSNNELKLDGNESISNCIDLKDTSIDYKEDYSETIFDSNLNSLSVSNSNLDDNFLSGVSNSNLDDFSNGVSNFKFDDNFLSGVSVYNSDNYVSNLNSFYYSDMMYTYISLNNLESKYSYGDVLNFTGYVNDFLGNPVNGSHLGISIDNIIVKDLKITNGNFSALWNLSSYFSYGTKYVNLIFFGNEKYYSSFYATQFLLSSISTNVSVDSYSLTEDYMKIFGSVKDAHLNNVSTGFVSISYENSIISQVNLFNGKFSAEIPYAYLNYGHSLKFSYSGNSVYESSYLDYKFDSIKQVVKNIFVKDISSYPKGKILISGNILDIFNNPVFNGYVNIFINNSFIGQSKVINGSYGLNYDLSLSFIPNSYAIDVFYSLTNSTQIIPNSTHGSANLIVEKVPVLIKFDKLLATSFIPGENFTLSGLVVDYFGNLITNSSVDIFLNNKFIANANVISGLFFINLTIPMDLNADICKFSVSLNETDYYTSAKFIHTAKLIKPTAKINYSLIRNNLTNNLMITGFVSDDIGKNLVNNGVISLKIFNTVLNTVNLANSGGVFSFDLGIFSNFVNNFPFYLSFGGTSILGPVSILVSA